MLGTDHFRAADGKALPYTAWLPEGGKVPRAAVVAVHGLSGASSDFWPLGDHLSARGIAVYAHELRGQGNDPDTSGRGDIRTRHQWFRDLASFVREIKIRHPGLPVFLHGESLGALIVLHGLSTFPQGLDVEGAILSSPVVGIRHRVGCLTRFALKSASLVAPKKRLSLGELAGEKDEDFKVTSATTHAEQMSATGHHVEDFTLRLFRNVGTMIDSSRRAARRLALPTLVLYTPNDVLVSKEQVEEFFDSVSSRDKTKAFFPDSYHLILHDVDREKALGEIAIWLDARLPK